MISGTREAVVVGGGLVGSLLATFLARRGYEVRVHERRGDLRQAETEGGRSINLVLTRRGIRALGQVDLDRGALALTVPVTGRMMHAVDGGTTFQAYGRDDTECNYSIPRSGLNAFLIEEAERNGVEFRFHSRLVDARLGTGRLCFRDETTGREEEVRAGVIFGADGAGSALRKTFEAVPGFEESVDMLDHGYKELPIPPGDDGAFRLDSRALHIWPREEFMLMALPNLDGSFTATLYLPHRGDNGFERLTTEPAVEALFARFFSDATTVIPDVGRAFFDNPTGSLGTVRCRPWHADGRALLIGDAAHGIVPFFGQGMNTGFEDCTVLGELLDGRGSRTSWREVFTEFDRLRKPNADAIADMALDNFVEMRDRVADDAFLLRKEVEHRLERALPHRYRTRYSMVMYSHIPFRLALEAGRIQQGILDELCRGVSSADDVDLGRAERLISERLSPFLADNDVDLGY